MQLTKEQILGREAPSWLQEKRGQAWEAFAATEEQQHYRYGLNIVTPLTDLHVTDLELTGNTIQVEGATPQAPPENVFSLLGNDRFEHLHKAVTQDFVHLVIPDNTTLEKPILVTKTMNSQGFFNHLSIDVGKNCKLAILESLHGGGQYHSGGTEIRVGEGSSLVFGSTQNLTPTTANVSFRKAHLERDARLEWVAIDTGSKLTLSRLHGTMAGSGSSLLTKLMAFGTHSQHFDVDVASTHSASDTYSDIVQKAVLDGQAKLVINGLVKIQQNAPRSNGYQKEDTLLLSPDAEASPIPNLEIDNNDVRCSHGTTVGQIDRSLLFYLMARGLDEETATQLVVKGFFEPMIETLPHESLQNDIRQHVNDRLAERQQLGVTA